jgi:hypothetical protein
MPEQVSVQNLKSAPPSPLLVAPRDAAVVNGAAVTFVWEGVETADTYLLQVASDTRFDDVVLEEEAGQKTALTVADYFPTDERTYFWRVLAKNDAGWCPGQRVESFVSATQEEADHYMAVPSEELGPVTELVRAASADVSAELGMSGADRYEKEVETGVAEEGIPSAQILGVAVSILVTIAVLAAVLFSLTGLAGQQAREIAVTPDQYTDLRQAEIEAARALDQYDVLDEEEGVYRIPIDRAMDLMANEAYQEGKRPVSDAAPLPAERASGSDAASDTANE